MTSPATPAARWGALAGLLLLCQASGGIAALITVPAVNGWYRTLVQPAITPPDGVFAPVWTLLYLAMAVAAWRAWTREGFRWDSRALRLFGFQLLLNFAWSFLFFGAHWIGAATLEIAALWLAVAATTRCFLALDRTAGLLMLPYLAWVSFAALLCAGFWVLN